jgi:hypothetical protein
MTTKDDPATPATPAAEHTAADLDRLATLVAHGFALPSDARRLRRAAQEVRRLAAEVERLEALGGQDADRPIEAYHDAGI